MAVAPTLRRSSVHHDERRASSARRRASTRRSRWSTSTPRGQRARHAAPRGRHADPRSRRSRSAAARCCERLLDARPRLPRHARVHAARGAVARRARASTTSSSPTRPPTARRCAPGRAATPTPAGAGDGRLRRAARPDRGGRPDRGAAARCACASSVDAGWWPLGGRLKVGAKRSPVRTPEQAAALAREIGARPGVELDGLMAYEAQIAGVGDRPPGRPLHGRGDPRRCSARSARELAERRAAVVAAVREVAPLRVRQRRRHRQHRAHGRRAGGHRGRGRLGPLRADAVRPLHAPSRRGRRRCSRCRSCGGRAPGS